MNLFWYDWAGYIGVALVLLAFFLLQERKLQGSGLTYQLMNILGAIGVMLSLGFGNFNLAAFIMQVAWLLIGGYGAYTGLTDGVGKAWVSRLLPAESQGTGQGIFQGVLGAGILVAGLWAGLAWGDDGHVPLMVSGVLAGVIGLVLLLGPRRSLVPAG